MTENARKAEALLFLSSEPVSVSQLADALEITELEAAAAISELGSELKIPNRGVVLREVAGGYTLAADPSADVAARRLFSGPRTYSLTQAQAECLAIVAYLQPVSRPEIARIRGVASESAVATLAERGLVAEAGRSRYGAITYRTTELFEKLFGLRNLDELPDPGDFDPTPKEAGELRDRLLRAGDQRSQE